MTPDTLKALMEANDLNVKKTAGLLHVTGRAVYHWLNGTRPITSAVWDHLLLKVASMQKPGNQGRLLLDGRGWSVIP